MEIQWKLFQECGVRSKNKWDLMYSYLVQYISVKYRLVQLQEEKAPANLSAVPCRDLSLSDSVGPQQRGFGYYTGTI